MKLYKRHEPIYWAMDSRWFHYFRFEADDGNTYQGFLLKLPSWGYGYSINRDARLWGQRMLRWHGRDGFSIGWYFPIEVSSISVTPDA
jgi:hypothetical protein